MQRDKEANCYITLYVCLLEVIKNLKKTDEHIKALVEIVKVDM